MSEIPDVKLIRKSCRAARQKFTLLVCFNSRRFFIKYLDLLWTFHSLEIFSHIFSRLLASLKFGLTSERAILINKADCAPHPVLTKSFHDIHRAMLARGGYLRQPFMHHLQFWQDALNRQLN